MCKDALSPQEQRLIERHLGFYKSLISRKRPIKTPEQQHFVDVFEGQAEAQTIHEIAFAKFVKIESAKRLAAIEEKAAAKSAQDDKIDEEPGQRTYPARLDKVFSNAKWTSIDDYK